MYLGNQAFPIWHFVSTSPVVNGCLGRTVCLVERLELLRKLREAVLGSKYDTSGKVAESTDHKEVSIWCNEFREASVA